MHSRPYRGLDDYQQVRAFLQSGWALTGLRCSLFHIGDLTWQTFMYTREVFVPEERVRLWERTDGSLAGFAWFYPKRSEVIVQIDPALRRSGEWRALAAEMLDWAESRRAPEPEATDPLFVSEFESDAEFIDFLAGLGFQRGAAPLMRLHRRRTDLPVPPATLPEGFTLRHVGDEAEWADRVESHREVWHPSKFTLDGYRQLRSSPGYDPELDLVAVAPDGTIAANTIVWHDEVNRTGQFEPVGTREAFRGLGLAKQLMYEGIRRLAAREAEWAFVNTFEDLEPACQLYLAAGFDIVDKWAAFARTESP